MQQLKTYLCHKKKSLKYKPQKPWRHGFFFSSLQTSKKKKVNFERTPLHNWLLLSYQRFALVLEIEAKRESGNFVSLSDFLVMGNTRANTFWSLQNARIQKLVVCSEISFSKSSYHVETSELICVENQLTSFCMIRFFIEKFFQTYIKSNFLCPSTSVLNCMGRVKSAERITLKDLNKPTHLVSQDLSWNEACKSYNTDITLIFTGVAV